MAQSVSGRLDDDIVDGLEEMTDNGDAENISEALRMTCSAGLRQYGYYWGEKRDTRLRKTVRRFIDAFALLGVMWIGVSFWLPLELRALAAAPFAASAACLSIDRVLATHEPAVSNWLAGLVRGDRA